MDAHTWSALQVEASKVSALEKLRLATELRIWQYRNRGFPDALVAPLVSALDEVQRGERALKKECAKIANGTAEAEWFDAVPGFGSAVWYVLGALPIQPGEYDTVSGLWKTFGLHVHDGSAVKRRRGESGPHQRFRQELRAWALYRLGEPHLKLRGGEDKNGRSRPRSPYRDTYDERRERTNETHPPMLDESGDLLHPECEHCLAAVAWTEEHRKGSHQQRERKTVGKDCANVGGTHWTDGHRHADALRVMTKAILRDIWRVWNERDPKYSGDRGHPSTDTHMAPAPTAGASR